jgi:class 3 adenylate cyclase
MQSPVRYARNGDATIAFRTLGEGAVDVLFLAGPLSHVEIAMEEPGLARFFERLATFCRVVLLDRRGSGLSDPLPDGFTIEQEAGDVVAVLDALGAERAVLLGYVNGAALAVQVAHAHPERCSALVFYAAIPRTMAGPGYDWASHPEERRERVERLVASWGTGSNLPTVAPSLVEEERVRAWFGRLERSALSPSAFLRVNEYMAGIDVTDLLPEIAVPSLVLHRTGDQLADVRHSRYVAEHLPGARLVELAGIDNLPSAGDTEALAGEIEEFLTGGRRGGMQRAMLTVLFTDIVDSTGHAARLGDGGWRDLLAAQERAVREVVERFNGHVVKTIGDAFLVIFDGPPSSALRCARGVLDAVRPLGLELRAGLHTGECEIVGDDVGGMAVHIAARVAALAEAGEILASGTAYGTVVGSGLEFEWRGDHVLKGVPGRWPVFALIA